MSRERFQDALWVNHSVKINVGGAGGIGSWYSFFATRAGFNVQVHDFDVVEEHNLGGQLFLHQDIGSRKIDALSNVVSLFNDEDFSLNCYSTKIDNNTPLYPFQHYRGALTIIVSAFDNMKARTDLFNIAIRVAQNCDVYFIDGRLLMEQMRIYCVNMKDETAVQDYAVNHLFDDSEVEELPCTMKQVSHGAAMIATHMMGFTTNIISNHFVWKEEVFKVPYIWDYIIPMNKITEHYEPTS